MDGRWLLLSLVVAVVAAVRWGHRAPEQTGSAAGRSADEAPQQRARSADRTDGGRADRAAGGQSLGSAGGESVEIDASVDAALERVWAEHAHDAEALLDVRLRQLVQRKVPVRAIRRAPGSRAVRVAFADGTVVLCRGSGHGDFGRLGLALHRQSVRLGTFAHDHQVTRLEFRWSPDQRLAAVAVGLDQPD